MAVRNLGKLEMLSIEAYKTSKRNLDSSGRVGVFKAMFNPESITQSHEIQYGGNQAIGTSGKQLRYAKNKSTDMGLALVLDGTGVADTGGFDPTTSVHDRVEAFLGLAFNMNGDIHEPNYLVVKWGGIHFNCRLGNLNVRYTHFNREGTALRAELDLRLIGDDDAKDLQKKERKSSPDLTHSRIVRAGDTLPLLAKEIYGSSAYYLWVAQQNGLDEIRRLTPGQRLVFPPLEPKAGP